MTGLQTTNKLSGTAYTLLWGFLWLAVMAAALKFRPLLPVDETRYLAVAWEMWRDKNFWVPHLNGETYSHKPPLLFWLMHIGWSIFGVNDWWPRLVAPLFGLSSLFLTTLLARRLWPGRATVALASPLILFACLFWTLFTSLTMFDMLLALCALIGMLAVVRAWQDDSPSAFFWLAVAIGLGGLAKGPAILLSTLPVALLAPLWTTGSKTQEPELDLEGVGMEPAGGPDMWSRGWKRWYIATGVALLGGIAIALVWAVPAAIMGGEEYRNAIFWGQSAGRMVDSFAHGRPWWWFLAVLPALVLPWTVWPASWRSLKGLLDIREDNGIRFCLVWFIPALITFSAISGKQLHYLLPVFPALALMLGRFLLDHHILNPDHSAWHRSGLHIPGGLFIVLGLILAIAPLTANFFDLPVQIADIDFRWGPGLAMLALVVIVFTPGNIALMGKIAVLSVLSAAFVVVVHLSLKPILDERFDLREISQQLSEWQGAGIALANLGKYHGQFNFMGRLEKPITAIGIKGSEVGDWIEANPEGRIIVVVGKEHPGIEPYYSQHYRSRAIIVIDGAQALANPDIIENP